LLLLWSGNAEWYDVTVGLIFFVGDDPVESVLMLSSLYDCKKAFLEGFHQDIHAELHARSDSAAHRWEGA
jgi:hypothetical protein